MSLDTAGLSAATDIDSDAALLGHPMHEFFASLAEDWRGWDEPKQWQSIDRTLGFSATHDGLGHVSLVVEIARNVYPDAWHVSATIKLDAGSLESIARDAASFTSA